MELREYLAILGRRWWVVLIMILIFGYGFSFYGKNQPVTYQGIGSVAVLKKPASSQTQSQAYLYDQYYNLQANQALSDMIASWIADPTLVAQIYHQANLPLPAASLEDMRKLISVRVNNRSSVEFSVITDTEAKSAQLIKGTFETVRDRLQSLEKDGALTDMVILEGKPLVQPRQVNQKLYNTVGTALGVLIGILSAFLLDSMLDKKRRD